MSMKEDFVATVTIPSSASPRLDYLRELSGGDVGFMTEILEMFIKEAPQSVAQAYNCLDEKNFELLRMSVHKLKSSVQVVGGQHLTGLIVKIESWSSGDCEELSRMVAMLDQGIQQMVEHLKVELQALAA